jgi:glycosyltransferase involved in cell wall biosynthesis
MEQIICFSTSNYHPYPTRKQNVMNRLENAEIIYFDPPVSLLAPLKDKAAKERLSAYKRPGQRVQDHISVFALPWVLPFANKYRFINKLNQKRLAKLIQKISRIYGFSEPHIWCYSPSAADIVEHLPHQSLIYDCVDRHSAYPGLIDPAVVDGMEADLAKAADIVFCTAAGLYQTLAEYNPQTYLIPNGVDYELFASAAGEKNTAGKAIFGFIGMLQDCIAYDYLLALADAFPQAEIRLIGKVMPGVDISALRAKENIRLLGLLPQQQLPAQMKEFDVCLNLFAQGKLAQDVSPLKFYEYLATGKPLVSTAEPLQVMDFAEMIYIADNIPDFIEQCSQALAEDDAAKREARMAAARAASWDRRVAQMTGILQGKGIFAAPEGSNNNGGK